MNSSETLPKRLSSLTIFFPAFNEEENVAQSIKAASRVAEAVTDDYEIIVVDDGSQDRTAQVVQGLVSKYDNLKLVRHEKNQGYGGAVWTGFDSATKDWIFFSDADLQFDLKEISKLIEYIGESDVVIGYRYNRSDPFIRSLNAWGWKILMRLVFGLNVRDVDCAFKLIKSTRVKLILPQIVSRGAMFSAELLIRLQQNGHHPIQIPVHHYPRPAGTQSGASLKVILRAFKEVLKVKKCLA